VSETHGGTAVRPGQPDAGTIARVAHAANREWCKVNGLPVREQWEQLDEGRRAIVISGVRKIIDGEVGDPRSSHESWMRDMAAQGWTYGATRNEELKQHECMVPYDQLPAADRMKDTLFGAIVRALAGIA
jgi:hypothetical protein